MVKVMYPNFTPLNKPNQRFLIAGGTGFLGRRLSQYLVDAGHRVTVLTRTPSRSARLFSGPILFISDLNSISSAEYFDVIINLAGENVGQYWTGKARNKIYTSRIDMIEKLIALVRRLKLKPALFLQSSAIGVYGLNESLTFDEDIQPHPDSGFSQKVCIDLENKARLIQALGVRLCILRTGLVLEKDGGTLERLLLPFKFGLGGPLGSGAQYWSWIHRDDWVGLVLHLINKQDIEGPLNMVAPTPVTNKLFAQAFARALHRPCLMPLPAFVVRLFFGDMGDELMLRGLKVLPKRAIESGYLFCYPEINLAFKVIFDSNT
jgi:uncharacterized protein (TIGR01777 family)